MSSVCDKMQIIIKNRATGIDGNKIDAKIVGVQEIRGTLRGISEGQTIGAGNNAEGNAYSAYGTKGWTEGKISISLLWGTVNETVYVNYIGEKHTYSNCTPTASVSGSSDYFTVTASSSPGKHEDCKVTFRIESKSQ